ncbi:MAG: NYN domain-containing protein [Candidatus Wallbacteria bacterium]|nr:NYN domain-containing protein [Candidatus Wallbacteria bacterium]
MGKKVAIIVDWDNFRKSLSFHARKARRDFFDYNDSKKLLGFFRNFLDADEELYRIFVYTAQLMPLPDLKKVLDELEGRKKFSQKSRKAFKEGDYQKYYERITAFNESMAAEEFFALRLGSIKIVGLDEDGSLDMVQKGVDMLLGLDIAHLAYLKLIDRIMVFSFDTDIKPALKCARIYGIQVILPSIEGSSFQPSQILKKHADILRVKKFGGLIGKNSLELD